MSSSSNPRHPYTRALLASIPGEDPGARRASAPGASCARSWRWAQGCPFRDRCPHRHDRCDTTPPFVELGAGRREPLLAGVEELEREGVEHERGPIPHRSRPVPPRLGRRRPPGPHRRRPGRRSTFDVLDASCGQITAASTVADLAALDFSRVDQVAARSFVEGARPGDTLEVELLDFQPGDWGWTAAIPGFGLLADEFPDPALRITRLGGGVAEFLPGRHDPARPVLRRAGAGLSRRAALARSRRRSRAATWTPATSPPAPRLWLPVAVPGALFSLGDGHAAQGDGEVCGTAIETPMRARVRLTVRRDVRVSAPEFETAGPLGASTNTAGLVRRRRRRAGPVRRPPAMPSGG